ncbi:CoA transferase [Bradyrhizobium sp. dw_78]|uniref:CaiB/BaiF CoA transferase family protein n=1 Tax=Bradyrhizobium sp. dw_78 TaxID=2719793 RepID=UPI001BD2265C|nr:CoA transferase [Bradyrhizobium sp. dw_78]
MIGPARCLQGIRILDVTVFEAGPACTEVLAWLGAEVIKVEHPKGGDAARSSFEGSKPGQDAPYFLIYNANKKSITADMKSPEGLSLIKRLIPKVDVFIENLAPGAVDRLGLDYEAAKLLNPDLIYAQIKGFGPGSQYEKYLAFDMITQAFSGIMSISGERDGPPVKPGITLGDTGTGMLIAVSILASLFRRAREGGGERLQVSMQDAMLQYIRSALGAQLATGKLYTRNGSKVAANPPSGIFPCHPGGKNDFIYIYTGRGNRAHWHRLLETIGRSDLIGDERYETATERLKRETEIDAMISDWTSRRDKREAMRLLGEAGVPAGAVMDTMEVHHDPELERRNVMQLMRHPVVGPIRVPTWPVSHDNQFASVQPSPLLGEHNHSIYREWLGLSDEELESLRERGTI